VRDVRRHRLPEDVEDDHEEQDPDRRIGQDRVERVTEPSTVQEVAHARHRAEEAIQEVMGPRPERLDPAILGVHHANQPASDHRLPPRTEFTSRPPNWIAAADAWAGR